MTDRDSERERGRDRERVEGGREMAQFSYDNSLLSVLLSIDSHLVPMLQLYELGGQ